MFYFPRNSISRLLRAFGLLVFTGLIGIAGTASAQDRRQNAPGEFDFYVLSLSWSPSFCEQASERGSGGRSHIHCGGPPSSLLGPRGGPRKRGGLFAFFSRAPPRPPAPHLLPSPLRLAPPR